MLTKTKFQYNSLYYSLIFKIEYDIIYTLVTFFDFTEYNVATIQPWAYDGGDEKL